MKTGSIKNRPFSFTAQSKLCCEGGRREIIGHSKGRKALIVAPKLGRSNGKWALKTKYFGAFPDTQIKLLENGYYIAHINKTPWHVPDDTEAGATPAKYMHNELGLNQKCAIIGMSCGGMQGIYFAAKYPQYISCMYLDAPVVNFLSCPGDFGVEQSGFQQMFELHVGMTKSELISYRNHPLDNLHYLVENNIPIIVFNLDRPDNIYDAVMGKSVGTLVTKHKV